MFMSLFERKGPANKRDVLAAIREYIVVLIDRTSSEDHDI